jgi:DNA-binding response OmpR family regulator
MYPTVLLSDDNRSLREMVASLLTAYGFRVLQATNGNQALQICQAYNQDIDLLLTDIEMGPGLTGIQLAEQLQRERPETKILLMSGACSESAIRVHGWEFIQKPFLPEGLKQKVTSVLG